MGRAPYKSAWGRGGALFRVFPHLTTKECHVTFTVSGFPQSK